jgi:hypothetical protein
MQIGQVVAVIVGLEHGLGQTQALLLPSQVARASKAAFAGQMLYIFSAALAKLSILALMTRLFNLSDSKLQHRVRLGTRSDILFWTGVSVFGAMVIWAILSIVAAAVGCRVSDFIRADQGHCSRQVRSSDGSNDLFADVEAATTLAANHRSGCGNGMHTGALLYIDRLASPSTVVFEMLGHSRLCVSTTVSSAAFAAILVN